MRTILPALTLLAFAGPALAQAPQSARLTYADAASPSDKDKPVLEAWLKAAKPDNPGGVMYRQVKVGERTISFVVGSTSRCDSGPNSFTSNQIWEDCPLDVISTGPGGTRTQVSGKACYLYIRANDPGIDGTKNYMESTWDPRTKVMELRLYRDGKPVPECDRSLAVQ